VKLKTDGPTGNTVMASKLGPKWVTLADHLKAKLAARFKQRPQLAQELADYIEAMAYVPWLSPKFSDELVKGCYAQQILTEWKRMKNGAGLQALYEMHGMAHQLFTAVLPEPTNKFNDMEKQLLVRYPMLKYSEGNAKYESKLAAIKPVIDYVNLVEAFNAGLASTTQKQVS
jgi:hypothetical protein